jgi:hypothetical protein
MWQHSSLRSSLINRSSPVWDAPQKALPPNLEPIPQSSAPDLVQDDGVINIGEPMDSDDSSTWDR